MQKKPNLANSWKSGETFERLEAVSRQVEPFDLFTIAVIADFSGKFAQFALGQIQQVVVRHTSFLKRYKVNRNFKEHPPSLTHAIYLLDDIKISIHSLKSEICFDRRYKFYKPKYALSGLFDITRTICARLAQVQ